MVEGVLSDFAHGQVPNIFAEKGYPVEWKYNRKGLLLKIAVFAAVVAGAAVLLTRKKDRSSQCAQH